MSQIQSPPLRTQTAREDVNGWSSPEGEHGQAERACALDSGSGFWPRGWPAVWPGSGNLASLLVLRASVHQVPDLWDMHSGWEPLQRRHFAVISAWLHAGLLGRCSFSSPPLLAMSAPPSSAGC